MPVGMGACTSKQHGTRQAALHPPLHRSLSGNIGEVTFQLMPGAHINLSEAQPKAPSTRVTGGILTIQGGPMDGPPTILDYGFLAYASVSGVTWWGQGNQRVVQSSGRQQVGSPYLSFALHHSMVAHPPLAVQPLFTGTSRVQISNLTLLGLCTV